MAPSLLELRVRILAVIEMSLVSVVCCQVEVFANGPITLSQKSYRVCVCVCERERERDRNLQNEEA